MKDVILVDCPRVSIATSGVRGHLRLGFLRASDERFVNVRNLTGLAVGESRRGSANSIMSPVKRGPFRQFAGCPRG